MPFVVDEHSEWDNGQSFLFHFCLPFVEFLSVEEQFAIAGGCVAGIACIHVFGYMQALYPQLAVIEETVAIVEAYFAIAHRLYFGAGEHDSGFQPVFNGIFKSGGAVFYVNFLLQIAAINEPLQVLS